MPATHKVIQRISVKAENTKPFKVCMVPFSGTDWECEDYIDRNTLYDVSPEFPIQVDFVLVPIDTETKTLLN